MRVLHVVNTLDPAGAGPVEAARLYAVASDESNQVEVLSLDEDVDRWRADWPVPVYGVTRAVSKYRYSTDLVGWIRRNSARFDAVVIHGIWHYHLLGVARALRGTSIPYFVILHGMLNPWFRRTYPLKHAKKTMFWHASVRRAIEDAECVLFLCEEERRLAFQTFSFVPKNTRFVPLGTQPSFVPAKLFLDRFPELVGKRVFLFLGRICYMKGCDLLVQAFAEIARQHSDVHLAVCGPDHEGLQAGLMRDTDRLGISSRVTWAGPLYGAMKASALAAAELFVLPSRCETFPIAVLEALANGIPVVITDDVNIHPTVRESNAGFVGPSSTRFVVDALQKWIGMPITQRNELGDQARRCYQAHFDLKSAVKLHLDALGQLLPDRRSALIQELTA